MSGPSKADDAYTIKRTLGFLTMRSQRLMSQGIDGVLQPFGLTVQQFATLQLALEGHIKVCSDIAKTLGLDTGGATRLVDQLEEKGLVARRREAGDRRLVSISVTPEGAERTRTARAASQAYLDGLLEAFAPGDRSGFIDSLELLVRRLEIGSP